jgi:predicted anti-sigma-YlaC factor YlaD
MDCKRAKSLIPYAADGELSDELYAVLQSHLSSCSDCAALFSAYSSVIDDLEHSFHSLSEGISLPDNFASVVLSRAQDDSCTRRLRIGSHLDGITNLLNILFRKRFLSYAVSITVIIVMVFAIGSTALILLDSTPIVSTKVSPGNFITFSVRPSHGGRVIAGVNIHSYCQVTKSTEEALR